MYRVVLDGSGGSGSAPDFRRLNWHRDGTLWHLSSLARDPRCRGDPFRSLARCGLPLRPHDERCPACGTEDPSESKELHPLVGVVLGLGTLLFLAFWLEELNWYVIVPVAVVVFLIALFVDWLPDLGDE